MLAVLQRIDLHLVERLLATASGESTVHLVSFVNQAKTQGNPSVPDGEIAASFRYLIEVKTVRNAIKSEHELAQITNHLAQLDTKHTDERLFVITPDASAPKALLQLGDPKVVWMSFAAIGDAIDDLLGDPLELVGDRTSFLLRELQELFRLEGLLSYADVVIVAARVAYPEYLNTSAYVCQAGRAFADGLTHLGFYADSQIKPEIARIIHRADNVMFSEEEAAKLADGESAHDHRIAQIIRESISAGYHVADQAHQVFLLSGPGDPDTVPLNQPVINTTKTASGKPWAWTLGQRYVRLESLRKSGTTTELDAS